MSGPEVRELSDRFEIGAHTVNHVDLSGATEALALQEIVESKSWVEETTGKPCRMFCPPKGRYTFQHLEMMGQAGYAGVRSVELLSLSMPRVCNVRFTDSTSASRQLLLMPTTIQAHPHGLMSYAKNALKRAAFGNLWLFLSRGCSTDWTKLAQSLMSVVLQRGGVFHLWGHSWELEETGQWQRLEEVLRFLSQFTSQATPLTNGQICQANSVAPVEVLP
jgi:hypothetical protein